MTEDERLTAAIDLIGRTGARSFQIRYDDDPEPTVWIADAAWKDGHECGAGMTPLRAVERLLETIVDGSTCVPCGRVAGVQSDFTARLPFPDTVCWYVYDPELTTYRRSCEGDEDRYSPVGRNDPCPCGSGEKFKRCHGGR